MFAYALPYGEQEIPYGLVRRGMGLHPPASARTGRTRFLEARVHGVRMPDQDGIGLLLEQLGGRFARLSQLWVDAGYQGRGKRWAEESVATSMLRTFCEQAC